MKEQENKYIPLTSKKIVEGSVKLEDLAAYAEEMGAPKLPSSGSQEYLQSIVNTVLFS